MVEALEEGAKRGADVGEVEDPARLRIDLASHAHANEEGVPVQATALVPLGHAGKAVGGFDAEFLEDFHAPHATGRRAGTEGRARRLARRLGEYYNLLPCPER